MSTLQFAELSTVFPKVDFNQDKDRDWKQTHIVPEKKVTLFSRIKKFFNRFRCSKTYKVLKSTYSIYEEPSQKMMGVYNGIEKANKALAKLYKKETDPKISYRIQVFDHKNQLTLK